MGSEKILRKQRVSLLLLDEFARVCRENEFRWFVDSGTLLGVMRHGGFIPWDDDIDIVMPREDYNRLIGMSKKVFIYPFQLIHQSICPAYNFSASLRYCESAEITRNSLTPFYRDINGKFLQNMGIGIDIEPLDYVPNDEVGLVNLSRVIFDIRSNGYITRLYVSSDERAAIQSSRKAFVERYDSLMTEINASNRNSGRVSCTPWWYFPGLNGYSVSSGCYSSYKEATFEGCKETVRVPVGYEEILSTYYGDWHTPTPFNLEHSLSLVIIDDKHSYKDYEGLNNDQIGKLILSNGTL